MKRDDKPLTIGVVSALVGLSPSSIYRRVKAGHFPPPAAMEGGTAVRWLESEVRAWKAKQFARRAQTIGAL